MQKIDIDGIIDELKRTKEWGEYTTFLGNKLFYERKTIEILLKRGEITSPLNYDLADRKDREEEFSVFKKLENIFIQLFLNKYRFCPYCGKHSLINYKNDKGEDKRFFDLDHVFPKNSYRFLTYNFYNLLPSCKLCNQAKSTKNFINSAKVGDIFYHPYFGYIERIDLRTNKGNKFKINNIDYQFYLDSTNSKFLKLDKIYGNSQDTKNDILFIRDKIEKIKTDKINSRNLKINKKINIEERKTLFFKNYYPEREEDILKFANGKLKKDLIENIDL